MPTNLLAPDALLRRLLPIFVSNIRHVALLVTLLIPTHLFLNHLSLVEGTHGVKGMCYHKAVDDSNYKGANIVRSS
eukprot:1158854-Pelagomonas_calceolata.AAC.5